MGFFSKFFGQAPRPESSPEDPLVPVPIPPLGALLLHLEKQKGLPLTEEEVLQARDKAVCIMMRVSHKQAMEEKRGYRDVDPKNAWEDWLAFRADARPNET